MTTVAFASEADYQTWHDGKCVELGIPYPGYNLETNEPAVTSQWTTAYIAPQIIDGALTVTLKDEEISADPTLSVLPVVEVRFPYPDRKSEVDQNGNPISVIEQVPPHTYEKQLPETWTDPNTGTTYNASTGATL